MLRRLAPLVVLVALSRAPVARAGDGAELPPIRVVTWNVERMFDARDDRDRADEKRTERQVEQKVANVAHVLAGIEGAGPPEIVALQEIESEALLRRVGERLHGKARFDVRFARPSGRAAIGIGVITTWTVLGATVVPYSEFATRPMLHVRLAPPRGDRPVLDLIVVHWQSMRGRKGGDLADDRLRFLQAKETRKLVDELRTKDPKIHLAIVGDFNATVGSDCLARGLGVATDEDGVRASDGAALFDAAARLGPSERGTTFWEFRTPPAWRGWSALDHVLLSPACLARTGPLTLAPEAGPKKRGAAVVTFARRPHRFEGPREGEGEVRPNLRLGVSDHFPFAVWLRIR